MSYNSETSSSLQNPAKKSDERKIIYGVLIAALLGTWGYIIWDKSKTNDSIMQLQTQYSNVDSARNQIQIEYNDALARLDSATGSNTQLQGALAERQTEINELKGRIAGITRNKNATVKELQNAKQLITTLNGKIDDMFAEIEKLKGENQQLTQDKTQLTQEKDQLTTDKTQLQQNLTSTETAKKEVENLASTLHASNMNITPIDIKGSGKEKETTTAKKVDLLRISFDLDENRLSPSGEKELYIAVTAPDGRLVTMGGGSGTFETREEGTKSYTSKVMVQYEKGKKSNVSFDWKQDGKYQLGDYKIEVYNNGFKIGEGKKSLKKGGLFG